LDERLVGTHGKAPISAIARARTGRRQRSAPLPLLLTGILLLIAACGSGSGTPDGQPGGSRTPDGQPRGSGTPAQPAQASSAAAAASGSHWKLTWDSDFGKPGALSKWLYYSGGTGFNLKQLQWYDATNASVNKSGQLVITADRNGDGKTCWYGPCQYTSARMETLNTFTQTYGKFEARIKFPPGYGLWPAFWIEGANVYQVGWPACGEIDIIEPNGTNPYLVEGALHARHTGHPAYLTVTQAITAGFHTYSVVWNSKGITWYFDGYAFSHMNVYEGWPFNKPFFIILNLAVGGSYVGTPPKSTPFPAKLIVDWVRVYRHVGG
jgi:beta-glucanase (GH16 family)